MPIIYTNLRFSSSENSIVEIELDTNFSYQFVELAFRLNFRQLVDTRPANIISYNYLIILFITGLA